MTAFFDSNILVYAYSADHRRVQASNLIADGGVINVQVLNEFTNVLHRKQRVPWPMIELAIASVNMLFPEVQSLTPRIHLAALPWARDHNVNIYDALIIAAALDANCDILFSEDMQDGRHFGNLQIVNPFKAQPLGF